MILTHLLDENESGRKALRIAAMLAYIPTQEQRPEILQVIANDYMDEVDKIPAYAVEAGIKSLLRGNCTKRPTLGQVREASLLYCRHYMALRDFINRLAAHWGET